MVLTAVVLLAQRPKQIEMPQANEVTA
jgi:hypothetical protein